MGEHLSNQEWGEYPDSYHTHYHPNPEDWTALFEIIMNTPNAPRQWRRQCMPIGAAAPLNFLDITFIHNYTNLGQFPLLE